MRISDFIGSRVLSLSGARICGVIAGVRVSSDLKRIKAAEVFTADDDDCERKYIDVTRIRSCGTDTAIIMNESALSPDCASPCRPPVNLPAFGEDGEPYGRITDMVTEDGWKVRALCTAERTFPLSDVLCRSDELVVFRSPGSHTRISSGKKRVPSPVTEKSALESDRVRVMSAPLPARYASLVGRRASRDVSDTSGERIAEAGEIVTRDTVALARERGAIVRLVASCEEDRS